MSAQMRIIDHMLATIALTVMTVAVTWVIAMPFGIYSALRQHSAFDYIFTFLGFVALAVPDFLLALLLDYPGRDKAPSVT